MNVSVNGEIVYFPDTMSEDEINSAIASMTSGETAEAQEPAEPVQRGYSQGGVGNYLKNTLRGVMKGQTLDWGDELAGYGRALADEYIVNPLLRATNPEYAAAEDALNQDVQPRQQSLAESARMYQQADEADYQEWAKRNPVAAFGSEIAGGFASPVNLVAPGLGTARNISQVPGQLLRPTIQRRIAESTGRGIVEGAIAGAGANAEDRLAGAQTGAMWGGGTALGLTGGGGLLGRTLSKRRTPQRLENTLGEFTPITIANQEGVTGDVYRQAIGRVWGANRALRQQESAVLNRLDDAVDQAQTGVDRAKRAVADDRALITDNAAVAREAADVQEAQASRRLDQEFTARDRETAVALADDARNFRAVAAQEAFPDDFRVQEMQGLDLEDPVAVGAQLDDFWKNRGFQMVKGREFNWNEGIVDDLREQFSTDPGLIMGLPDAPEMVEALRRTFGLSDELADYLKAGRARDKDLITLSEKLTPPPTLKIDGDALMEMRNYFARRANRGGDNAYAYNRVKQSFDDVIREQLDVVGREQYQDQLARWTTHLNYRAAARRAKDSGGRFNESQYLKAGERFGDFSTGGQPLQAEATAVGQRKEATKLVKASERARVAQRKRRLADRKKAQKNRINRNVRDARNRLRDDTREAEARYVLEQAQAARQGLKTTPENVSGLSSLLTAGVIGGWASGLVPTPIAAAVPVGIAASRVAATKPVQKAFAGQTRKQRQLAVALRRGDLNETARVLARERAREEEE